MTLVRFGGGYSVGRTAGFVGGSLAPPPLFTVTTTPPTTTTPGDLACPGGGSGMGVSGTRSEAQRGPPPLCFGQNECSRSLVRPHAHTRSPTQMHVPTIARPLASALPALTCAPVHSLTRVYMQSRMETRRLTPWTLNRPLNHWRGVFDSFTCPPTHSPTYTESVVPLAPTHPLNHPVHSVTHSPACQHEVVLDNGNPLTHTLIHPPNLLTTPSTRITHPLDSILGTNGAQLQLTMAFS